MEKPLWNPDEWVSWTHFLTCAAASKGSDKSETLREPTPEERNFTIELGHWLHETWLRKMYVPAWAQELLPAIVLAMKEADCFWTVRWVGAPEAYADRFDRSEAVLALLSLDRNGTERIEQLIRDNP